VAAADLALGVLCDLALGWGMSPTLYATLMPLGSGVEPYSFYGHDDDEHDDDDDDREERGIADATVVLCDLALGWGMSPTLYATLMPAGSGVDPHSFAVFICVAISITAFPVLGTVTWCCIQKLCTW
jgi:hypothetical protein